jgi:hypothetical protein
MSGKSDATVTPMAAGTPCTARGYPAPRPLNDARRKRNIDAQPPDLAIKALGGPLIPVAALLEAGAAVVHEELDHACLGVAQQRQKQVRGLELRVASACRRADWPVAPSSFSASQAPPSSC